MPLRKKKDYSNSVGGRSSMLDTINTLIIDLL